MSVIFVPVEDLEHRQTLGCDLPGWRPEVRESVRLAKEGPEMKESGKEGGAKKVSGLCTAEY